MVRWNKTTGHHLLREAGLARPVDQVSDAKAVDAKLETHVFQLLLVLRHELWVDLNLSGLERWCRNEIEGRVADHGTLLVQALQGGT